MKVYARLALALLSCATALVLATGAAAAHTANHTSTAAQVEALVVEPAETGEVAADNIQSQVNAQTPAVAETSDEDEDEDDTDEDGPDEQGTVENLAPSRQSAPAAAGTHADAGAIGASDKAEGTDG